MHRATTICRWILAIFAFLMVFAEVTTPTRYIGLVLMLACRLDWRLFGKRQ